MSDSNQEDKGDGTGTYSRTIARSKASWTKTLGSEIVCRDCKKKCPRTGTAQKFCRECSAQRDVARKSNWFKNNPLDPAVARERAKTFGVKKRSRMLEEGAETSEANRMTIADVFADEEGMAWVRRIEFPFSYAMSKNHIYAFSPKGHVHLRKESQSARSRLSEAIAEAVRDANVVTGKIWIDIIVHKPNHRGDAINVVDLVADAIKDAIPVDDRWYAIRRLDWRIVKNDPTILIGLGQKETEDHQVCSYCGRALPLKEFSKRKGSPNGCARACCECTRRKPA